MQTEPLSNSTSSAKISVKEIEPGKFITQSSGRYNFIIFPALILGFIIGPIITFGGFSHLSAKDLVNIVFIVAIFGAVIYFFQNFMFQQFEFDINNNSILKNKHPIASISDIKELQLLTYHKLSGNNRIRFEINLVKNNNERICLFNNSNFEYTSKQARKLANALKTDIIDLTSE